MSGTYNLLSSFGLSFFANWVAFSLRDTFKIPLPQRVNRLHTLEVVKHYSVHGNITKISMVYKQNN